MDCVCASTTFGEIRSVDTILMINMKDLERLNVTFPLTAGQGCVRRIARYALLITTLMLEGKNKPIRAMVGDCEVDEQSGQPISANCMIEFTGDVTLRCKGAYLLLWV